jgi:hypothetical protein
VIIVTPQNEAPHPEWADLFTHPHDPKRFLLEMRILGSRVGYFVNDLRSDPQGTSLPLFFFFFFFLALREREGSTKLPLAKTLSFENVLSRKCVNPV